MAMHDFTVVVIPSYGTTTHACHGKWPVATPDGAPSSGGSWTTRDTHTVCGVDCRGMHGLVKPISEVTCGDCLAWLAADRLVRSGQPC